MDMKRYQELRHKYCQDKPMSDVRLADSQDALNLMVAGLYTNQKKIIANQEKLINLLLNKTVMCG